MASVTPEERRILMDVLGYGADGIEALTEARLARHLEAYYSQQKTGFYNDMGAYTGPVGDADPAWVADGLAATAWDIAKGLQETGDVVITTSRQVGTDLAEGLTFTAGLSKLLIPAAIALAGYILYLRYGAR